MQDMPIYATRKGLEFACYLEPDSQAKLTSEFFVRLNYEGYFFCKPEERASFLSDPLTYCGLLTDPVSKQRFRPTSDSPKTDYEGVSYYFESEQMAQFFAADPDTFKLPGFKMKDMDAEDGEQEDSPEENAETS